MTLAYTVIKCLRNVVISTLLSLRLKGVETLESVLQNFQRRFHFFNLVSEISQKTGCNYNIRVQIYLHF